MVEMRAKVKQAILAYLVMLNNPTGLLRKPPPLAVEARLNVLLSTPSSRLRLTLLPSLAEKTRLATLLDNCFSLFFIPPMDTSLMVY